MADRGDIDHVRGIDMHEKRPPARARQAVGICSRDWSQTSHCESTPFSIRLPGRDNEYGTDASRDGHA